jgi:transposase
MPLFTIELLMTLLGLSDIEITEIKLTDDNTLQIFVTSTKEGCSCHQCGKPIEHYYGIGQEIQLRHLSVFGYKTYIILTPKRYQCEYCDKKPTTTQILDWYLAKNKHTKAYDNYILLSLINSTVKDVSLKNDIGYDAVEGIVDRYFKNEVDWNTINTINVIGIDEISIKKGHRDFVTIVSAYVNGLLIVLAVLEDRTKATIKKFFLAFPRSYENRLQLFVRTYILVSLMPQKKYLVVR